MSDYFDASLNRIVDGLTARATDVNTLRDEVGTAFELLPDPDSLSVGSTSYCGASTGSANAYVVIYPTTLASYVDGMTLSFKANFSNTAAATVNVSGLGAKSLKRQSGEALMANDVLNGKIANFRYNSTVGWFELYQAGNTQFIPQNSQSADYTAVLEDSGKHLLHPSSDNNPRTFHIPTSAAVDYPIGTAITIVNLANTLTIYGDAGSSLLLAGVGSSHTVLYLPNGGIATALLVAADKWVIGGPGLSS